MTIGIYSITHIDTSRRYIGKSVNVEARLAAHKYRLTAPTRSAHHTNRYLFAAVHKYGWDAFETKILETFQTLDPELIADREIYWMDYYRTCEPQYGFNLRRDSSSGMITHSRTKELLSKVNKGALNGNFGNLWSEQAREAMRQDRLSRADRYGESWRAKLSRTSKRVRSDPEINARIGRKVAETLRKYDFVQLSRDGSVVRFWTSIEQILRENPAFKKQCIYAVCDGHKRSYLGFGWRKVLKLHRNPELQWLLAP